MKEHPILFKPEMVRAILGGYKTQTRRLAERGVKYKVGDLLWVRENIGTIAYGRHYGVEVVYSADNIDFPTQRGVRFEHLEPVGNQKYRTMDLKKWPSIFMPRWASRITLEVTGVRVEPLISISDSGIDCEGVTEELIRELIWPVASKLKVKNQYWFYQNEIDDESYCYDCGEKRREELIKLHPDEEISLMGVNCPEDHQTYCATCNVCLDNCYTEYACECDLDNFEKSGFAASCPEDCFSLVQILCHDGWNGKLSDRIKKLSWQILWDSINLKPTPIKQKGIVVSYESYPSSSAVFDSAYPGVRNGVFRGLYKDLPIQVFGNPEVAVITFKRIS